MKTTNVRPSQLNYDKYTSNKYDKDIVNSIPFHREIHNLIAGFVTDTYKMDNNYHILDLGVGTAITSKVIKDILPKAEFDVIDFSRQMLAGAKKKMGVNKVNYIYGDYSKIKLRKKYDIVVSVIGIHHQNQVGKKRLFKKIYNLLKPNGVFIFGDLVTYKNRHEAALNNAKHYKHLVDESTDEKTLSEWAFHHQFLNDLSPIEDQIEWLKNIGFKTKILFSKFNTALIISVKK